MVIKVDLVSVLCYNCCMIETISILHNPRGHSASVYVKFVEESTENFLFGSDIRYAFNSMKLHNNSTKVVKSGTTQTIATTNAVLYPPLGDVKHWEVHLCHDFSQGFPEVYKIPAIPELLLDNWNDIVAKWTNPKAVKKDSFDPVY